jgi:isoleucyl-tRNA synthetase
VLFHFAHFLITDGTLHSTALGADGLRLWVALHGNDATTQAKIGQTTLQELKARIAQIRLSLRFILGALHGYSGQKPLHLRTIDKVSNEQLYGTDGSVIAHSESYGDIRGELRRELRTVSFLWRRQ